MDSSSKFSDIYMYYIYVAIIFQVKSGHELTLYEVGTTYYTHITHFLELSSEQPSRVIDICQKIKRHFVVLLHSLYHIKGNSLKVEWCSTMAWGQPCLHY